MTCSTHFHSCVQQRACVLRGQRPMEDENPVRTNFACTRSVAMESNKEFDFVPAESNHKLESCGERKKSQTKIFEHSVKFKALIRLFALILLFSLSKQGSDGVYISLRMVFSTTYAYISISIMISK